MNYKGTTTLINKYYSITQQIESTCGEEVLFIGLCIEHSYKNNALRRQIKELAKGCMVSATYIVYGLQNTVKAQRVSSLHEKSSCTCPCSKGNASVDACLVILTIEYFCNQQRQMRCPLYTHIIHIYI
jgi:hypothetical protein